VQKLRVVTVYMTYVVIPKLNLKSYN